MVILVVCVLMVAGSLACRANAKSPELQAMAETLNVYCFSLANIYLDMREIYLDCAEGNVPKSDIDLRKAEIDSKRNVLKKLSDDIITRWPTVMPGERLAWRCAYNCTQQMSSACFSLIGAALKIEAMGTGMRFSEGWMRQYEVASVNLDLASVRLDMANLMWDLLMAQP